MAGPELAAAWDSLEKDPAGSGFNSQDVYSDAPVELAAGIRADGTRMFVFACSTKAAENVRLPASSEGFEVGRLSHHDRGPDKFVACILLRNNKYRELFDAVIQDIGTRAGACNSQAEGFKVVIARITEWQNFLARVSPDGLSNESRRGLFGELNLLRTLVRSGLIDRTGLDVWTGPHGANQDFQFRNGAVEVKVSLAAQNQELIISSERQLDSRGYAAFYIYHLALTERRQTGETLNAIVDSVRELLSIEMLSAFDDLLFEYGYSDVHRNLYESYGYVIRESNFFEVRDGFPRITEEFTQTVPGVGKVKYSISVPACQRFRVSEETVLAALRGLYE